MTDFLTGDTIDLSDTNISIFTYVDSVGCTGRKMKKINLSYPLVLLLTVLMVGCTNKSKEASNDDVATSTSDQEARIVNIDFDHASEIPADLKKKEIIRFDDDTDNFPGGIQQITVKGDTVFVVDPIKNPGLYAYLKDGTQIFAYCYNGSGPEDIGSPMNLTVTDSEINVFDFAAKKLISFTKDGRFKHTIDLSMDVTSAIKDQDGGIWMDFSNQQYGDEKLSWKKDEENNPTTVLTVPDHLKGMTIAQLMSIIKLENGELRYLPSIEPYIYELRNGKAKLIYELDFMGKWPTNEEIVERFQGNDWAQKFRNFPIHIKGFAENDQWLVVGANFNKKLYITVYDKLAHTSRTYVDSQQEYFNPLYVVDSDLYMNRSDDCIEILKLSS